MPDSEDFMHDVIKQISEERARDAGTKREPFSFAKIFTPLFSRADRQPNVYTTQVISRPRTPGVFP